MALPRAMCRVRCLLINDISVFPKFAVLINSVPVNKYVRLQLTRDFRTNISSVVLNMKESSKDQVLDTSSSSTSDSDSTDSDSDSEDGEVSVAYHRGLPQITVPLPSRKERCRFTLKPITNTVGDFLDMLKKEDKGIDRAACMTKQGIRIAASNTVETLLDDDFKLVINDQSYNVNTPKQERLTGEEVQRVADIKNLVSQLYEALHIQEHEVSKEKELVMQLEQIQQELLPLEQKKLDIELEAVKKSNWLTWAGLGYMSVQFGILARLTWWEYSWDIMEPVTYFVTYGTAMACYAYFLCTREEYVYQNFKDRQQLLTMHKRAKKEGLDLVKYNLLKEEAARIEYILKKLRHPLKLRPTPKPIPAATPLVIEAVPEAGATVTNDGAVTAKTTTTKTETEKSDKKSENK